MWFQDPAGRGIQAEPIQRGPAEPFQQGARHLDGILTAVKGFRLETSALTGQGEQKLDGQRQDKRPDAFILLPLILPRFGPQIQGAGFLNLRLNRTV